MTTYNNTLNWNAYASIGNISASLALTGDVQAAINTPVPAATTNQEILIALDVSALQLIVVYSNVAVTIKTNSSGSPTDTIAIKAGIPYVWHLDAYATNLFTGDVSKIFVTNATGTQSDFQLIALTESP